MKVLQALALVSTLTYVRAQDKTGGLKLLGEDKRRFLSPIEDSWDLQSHECMDALYHLFLHVENHLMLVAVPEESAPEVCQPLTFHNKAHGKVIETVNDYKTLVSLLGESLQIQNGEGFTLSELETAFDHAHDVVFDEDYNVINHNCADLLFDMSDELGILVTDSIMDFVVGKLVQGGNIAQLVRSAPNLSELELSSEAVEDDFVLVDALVKHYTEVHSR